ncbi:MAG: hypothetical protein K2W97_02900 [Chthoniobacterales bacterium]|nr:hypothetical protein [Chthoniobacterales bacterium]
MLVALDLVRPAAIEQLVTLGKQIEVPVFAPVDFFRNSTSDANCGVAPVLASSSINYTLSRCAPEAPGTSSPEASFEKSLVPGSTNVLAVAREALAWCEQQHGNVTIFDTAGRREIDEALVNELSQLKELFQPQEILLVCDGATGQQAVSVAERFHAALGLTGLILTKLDGDARGGAALSLRSVTGRPIKFVGVGEKLDQWDLFHPDRLAGRILGMGDIVSFVEKAAEAVEMDEMMQLEKKLKTSSLDLNDFLAQLKMIRRMGPLENLVGMLPGGAKLPPNVTNGKELTRIEAIIFSMTLEERKRPEILNARRRHRIAQGSGTTVTEVNSLLLRFQQLKKMTKNMGNMKKMLAQFGKSGLNMPNRSWRA